MARRRQDTTCKWPKPLITDPDAITVEDCRPKHLSRTTMAWKTADAAIGATKTALIETGRKHGMHIRLAHPAHHHGLHVVPSKSQVPLPLSERTCTCTCTCTCTTCEPLSPRDKNSAHVMLVQAGLNPADADRARTAGPLLPSQSEPGIPIS